MFYDMCKEASNFWSTLARIVAYPRKGVATLQIASI